MTQILVDGSNAWYRAYCAVMTGTQPGMGIVIFSSMLRKLARTYGKENIIVCWDLGDSGRKQLDPEYKAGRTSVKDVWTHMPLIKKLTLSLGISTSEKEGYEADDIIGSLINKYPKTYIMSYDKDFYQLITDSIHVLRPSRKIKGVQQPDEIIDPKAALEDWGCIPSKIPFLKAFLGDASDNIPKLPIRLTAGLKKEIIDAVNTANVFEEIWDHDFSSKFVDIIEEFRTRATTSYKMLLIQKDIQVSITPGIFNASEVENICQKANVKSLKIAEWDDLEKVTTVKQKTLF